MKTVILFISIVNFSLFSQEIPLNDPSYSVHNYKHPNKAAAAAKRDSSRGVRVSIDATNRDYKKVASKQTESVLKIIQKDNNLKRVNYKMPNN
ncbi:hypothetical protein VB796_02905 [Arcicella sp. LKC2W]|uniref:hypothetical protein n=1 Tax=Arcicella sp. LKC2W TaxID=2984198 RepID=UPI002B2141E0|nr:hypothetical protein [Arcicella sp. LKC2W]MEA5457965.1 hypothetical protein [Arcicella sp. LKC2W]